MAYVDGARYHDKDGKVIEINNTGSDTDGTLWTTFFYVKNGKRSLPTRRAKTNTLVKRFEGLAQ